MTRRCSDARRSASTLLRCRHDSVFRWAWAGVKAVVYERYGSSDVLRLEDVPVPSPAAGQVRVRVAATSVNLSDWEGLGGSGSGPGQRPISASGPGQPI